VVGADVPALLEQRRLDGADDGQALRETVGALEEPSHEPVGVVGRDPVGEAESVRGVWRLGATT